MESKKMDTVRVCSMRSRHKRTPLSFLRVRLSGQKGGSCCRFPVRSFFVLNALPLTLLFFLFFPPLFTNATANADTLLDTITTDLTLAVPIVVGLGVLFFLWGLALYILSAADETKKAEGRDIMVWGVITLFVMVSVWGLVELLQNTLQIKSDPAPPIPRVAL